MWMSNTILAIGLSITGFAVGYMVGGSSTPVVNVAIPLLFGLIVTSFGLLTPQNRYKEVPKDILADEKKMTSFFKENERRKRDIRATVGLTLIFFSVFYLCGTAVGSHIRINEVFYKSKSPGFPWENDDKPKNVSTALDWITLQAALIKCGYTRHEIKSLYAIQRTEWLISKNDKEKSLELMTRQTKSIEKLIEKLITVPAFTPTDSPGAAPFLKKDDYKYFLDIITKPIPGTSPLAYSPNQRPDIPSLTRNFSDNLRSQPDIDMMRSIQDFR